MLIFKDGTFRIDDWPPEKQNYRYMIVEGNVRYRAPNMSDNRWEWVTDHISHIMIQEINAALENLSYCDEHT